MYILSFNSSVLVKLLFLLRTTGAFYSVVVSASTQKQLLGRARASNGELELAQPAGALSLRLT